MLALGLAREGELRRAHRFVRGEKARPIDAGAGEAVVLETGRQLVMKRFKALAVGLVAGGIAWKVDEGVAPVEQDGVQIAPASGGAAYLAVRGSFSAGSGVASCVSRLL